MKNLGIRLILIIVFSIFNINAMDKLAEKSRTAFAKVKEAVYTKLTPQKATEKLAKLLDSDKKLSVDEVKSLIEAGANKEIKNKKGQTVLVRAVADLNKPLINYLLQQKVDPNNGLPLIEAVQNNKIPIVAQLLDAGANADQHDAGNIGALYHAIFWANVPMVELLLKRGADANIQTAVGNTPLIIAIEHLSSVHDPRNLIQIIKLLLDYGADITLVNEAGLTPVAIAKKINNKEIIELLTSQRKKKLE